MLLDYVRTEQAHRALLCIVSPDINISIRMVCKHINHLSACRCHREEKKA